MKTKSVILVLIISVVTMFAFRIPIITGMTDAERQQLLDDSTNFANDQSNSVDVGELQSTVEIPPVDAAEQKKLESYKDDPGQMTTDGSTSLDNSGIKDFFIQDRTEFSFTENDPLMKTATDIRNSDLTECTSDTTTTTGTDYNTKSTIETCEVFRNYDMESCNITQDVSYDCNFSSNNIFDRNDPDKVRLDIACSGEDSIDVTVDAWGGKGKCAGPVTIAIDLNTNQPDWINITTLRPHWEGSCVDLGAYYKGGCSISCVGDTCTEECSYDFKFENGLYLNEVNFKFSRVTFTENNSCDWYEQCVSGGDCGSYDASELYTETCLDSACRTIKGEQVCPDCWDRKREYAMFYTENLCQPLIDRGCGQIASNCIKRDANNVCVLIENTYECFETVGDDMVTGGSKTFTCAQDIPCVGESCFDITYQASPDFKESVTYLSVVDEMANDIDTNTEMVFKGDNKKCSKWLLNSKSCCGSDKGWLVGCNTQEEQLADARNENVAYFIGSYCATSTLFGLCLEKKESYCTFNSILSRIIQEEGRAQLGISWGSPENTDCRAFTLDEIELLDFEVMDFSDFIADLEYNKNPDTSYDPNDFQGNP